MVRCHFASGQQLLDFGFQNISKVNKNKAQTTVHTSSSALYKNHDMTTEAPPDLHLGLMFLHQVQIFFLCTLQVQQPGILEYKVTKLKPVMFIFYWYSKQLFFTKISSFRKSIFVGFQQLQYSHWNYLYQYICHIFLGYLKQLAAP